MGALARKIFSLGAHEWRDLMRAQWALIVAQLFVRRRPAGSLTTRAELFAPARPASEPRQSPTKIAAGRARGLGDSVRRAAKYGVFRPQCLVRSIALQRLLIADGIAGAVIRVGVRQSEAGMEAHAWVELAGEVIGDSLSHVREYAPLDDLSVVS
ncbi:MAG: lasso peptide biosynthesis B2 protein [Gemmatimonadaceae bacterium]